MNRTFRSLIPQSLGLFLLLFSAVEAVAELTVFFPDDKAFVRDDRDFLVESTLPGTFKTPEGVVAAMLFMGNQVANKELTNPFDSELDGFPPIGTFYRGARIADRVFIVSFTEGAMKYLNNTVARQQYLKGALEASLRRNFPEIESVAYEIDGTIVTEWDA